MVQSMAGTAALAMAASFPIAAQVSPAGGPGIPGNPSPMGSTSAMAKEAQGWLTDLIKINTTNPPGKEQIAAMYVAGVLAKEGIKAELLDLTPRRSAVVARLQRSAMAESSRALLLVAHLDTVPVDMSRWSVDPFGGVIKDGYIYGRGAIDDKGMLAANLAVFIELKRSMAHLNRDVIFLATADEETGGGASMRMLIAGDWGKLAGGGGNHQRGNGFVKIGESVQYRGEGCSVRGGS